LPLAAPVLAPGCPSCGAGAEVAGPVLPGVTSSMDRVRGLPLTLRPGSPRVLATPGAGTANAFTLGDIGATVLGAVAAGPAPPPPPRVLPPLELAPPGARALGHDRRYIGDKATKGLKASRFKKRMAAGVVVVSTGCLSRTKAFVCCSRPPIASTLPLNGFLRAIAQPLGKYGGRSAARQ
jgi:hypothetical protein